jgi:hypothetical protein
MKVLYLIASHTNPEQVSRLVKLLRKNGANTSVLIHHDPSHTLAPDLTGIDNVYQFPKPVAATWGTYSQIHLFLSVTRWAIDNLDFERLVYLSGQDYPIRPITAIEYDLAKNDYDVQLAGYRAIFHPAWRSHEGYERYFFHYYDLPKFPYIHRFPASTRKTLEKIPAFITKHIPGVRYRWRPYGFRPQIGIRRIGHPFANGLECYAGPQWGNFSKRAIDYLHRFVDENDAYVRHYMRVLLPDESFVHSVFFNAAAKERLKVSTDNRRYVHWEDEKTDSSPCIIRTDDIKEVLASGADFARKFDVLTDSHVLDEIDRLIHES